MFLKVFCFFLVLDFCVSDNTESVDAGNEAVVDETDEPCNLTGIWYNQHNSRIEFIHKADGSLEGQFKTGVESKPGSAGEGMSTTVRGRLIGDLFVFSAFWRGGKSATGWTGQCHKEAKKTVLLKTSWILTSVHDGCDDHWGANRFGVDTFHRTQAKLSRPHLPRSCQKKK